MSNVIIEVERYGSQTGDDNPRVRVYCGGDAALQYISYANTDHPADVKYLQLWHLLPGYYNYAGTHCTCILFVPEPEEDES